MLVIDVLKIADNEKDLFIIDSNNNILCCCMGFDASGKKYNNYEVKKISVENNSIILDV